MDGPWIEKTKTFTVFPACRERQQIGTKESILSQKQIRMDQVEVLCLQEHLILVTLLNRGKRPGYIDEWLPSPLHSSQMSIQKQVKFTSLFVVDYNNVMNYGRLPHLRSLPETYPAVNLPADITQWYILRRVKTLLLKNLISFQILRMTPHSLLHTTQMCPYQNR